MRTRLLQWTLATCTALAGAAWADESPADPATTLPATPPAEWVWSLGLRVKMPDMRQPGQMSLHPMIGLRYGRWRAGAVDGETWHRFGQIKTDNTLTYDWLNTQRLRTSLSASIINLQRDSTLDALQSGRKTVRGKATIDYLSSNHWSVGLVVTQDLLNRGAGTALSPSLTYRRALTDDSTILLSHSFTWANAQMWGTSYEFNPQALVHQGSGWGSMDSSITLRQRWKAHWSWFAQLNRSQTLGPFYPTDLATLERTGWSAQAGVIYFAR